MSGGFVINGTFKTANLIGFSGNSTTALNTVTNTPTVTLGSASTVEYTSTVGASPVITGRGDYANLTVSGTNTAFTFSGSAITSANYLQTAGTVTLTSAATTLTLKISGTFTQSGGQFNVTGATATAGATVTVTGATSIFSMLMEANAANFNSTVLFQANGDATFTGSSTLTAFDWMAGGTSGTSYPITFGIVGNFNWSNATGRPYTTGSGSATGFVFNGAGTTVSPQTLTYSGSAIAFGGIFAVSTGTVVRLLTSVALGTSTMQLKC